MAASDGIDNLLTQLGTGRWNYLFFATCTMIPALLPIYLIGSEFMNPEPVFSCNIPDDNYTRPVNGSQCLMIEEFQGSEKVVSCKDWTYDTSVFHSTISMEWNLVCDRAWVSPLFQTIFTVGNFFGALMGAVAADRYGRRCAVKTGIHLTIASTILMLLVPWISLVLIARFLMGAFTSMMICPAFIMATEVCEPNLRTTVGIVLALPYALMMIGLSGIAYLIRDWRLLQTIAAFPCLFMLVLVYLVDESPRWLVVKGRLEEAVLVFERAVRLNQSKLPEDLDLNALIGSIHKKLSSPAATNGLNEGDPGDRVVQAVPLCDHCRVSPELEGSGTCLCQPRGVLGLDDGFGPWWAGPVALFRTAVMRKIMLVLMSIRILQGIVYLGIPLNSGAFSSPFLYMALLGTVELPAYTLTAPITRRLGRRMVAMPCLIMCGAFLLCYLTIKEIGIQKEWLHISLVLISYLFVCTAYQVNFLFAPELIPTTLRPWGTAVCILSAYVGFSITPFITDYPPASLNWISSAVFGSAGVIAGLLVFFLPETNGRDLPETVGDLRDRLDRERLERSQQTPGVFSRLMNTRTKSYSSTETYVAI